MDAHANLAVSLVATAPSPASSGTSLVVTAAQGSRFPAVPFNASIWPVSTQPDPSNCEIVRVTARSTDTLTITRAQEGTSARTVIVGDQIAATITVLTLTDIETVASAAVPKSLYDANTVLAATTDDTPAAVTMAASTVLARLAAGNIKAATAAELAVLLGVEFASRGTSGSLASTYDRVLSTQAGGLLLSTGILGLVRILLPKGLSVTNITFFCGSTALTPGTGSGNQIFGLFDSSRVRLAITADDGLTAWAANTAKTLAVTGGPFVTTYSGWHYVGICVKTGTGGVINTLEALNNTGMTTGSRIAAPAVAGRTTDSGLTNAASWPATAGAITVASSSFSYAEVS